LDTDIYQWLTTRVLDALPRGFRDMLLTPVIKSSTVNQQILSTRCTIWLPAYIEVSSDGISNYNSYIESYKNEGSKKPIYTTK
jgi:hypothetical protein